MKTLTLLFCAASFVQPMIALAQDTPSATSAGEHKSSRGEVWTRADTSFALETLHETNLHEIAAGQLAKERGTTDAIMSFGDTLQNDHKAADQKVESVAKARKLSLLPHLPSGAGADKSMQGLRELTGVEFDRRFLAMMVHGHDQAIAMVKKWQKDTNDKNLRSLLDELLPKLEGHRESARALARR